MATDNYAGEFSIPACEQTVRVDFMRIIGLDHVQLAMPAGGETQARDFYSRILGLQEIPKPSALAGRGGAWFRCGRLQIHLGVEKDFRPARKAHPALLVEQLEQLLTSLRDGGFEVTDDKSLPEIRRAFTADPFGNRVELIASPVFEPDQPEPPVEWDNT